MKQNYCFINKNKIYAEIYDELLEEELSMNNKEHNDKIKNYIEKKIINYDINLSDFFTNTEDIISDLIEKITLTANNKNLQGNTVLLYANENEMYELFHMEDLRKTYSDDELNELASITNIHLLPIYWGCGVFKTNYSKGILKGDEIKKIDLAKIFIQNYYHIGIIINLDNKMQEIEFTGEDPFKIIGNNFIQSNVVNIMGFNFCPYIEKSNIVNNLASKLLGIEIKGRVFISLLCPTTNKKFWNINISTINNIIKILENKNLNELINKEINITDKDINPFFLIKKIIKC